MTDRMGPERIMAAVFLLAGIATVLLGMASGHGLVLLVFLQPLFAVCFFPAGFAALSSISSPGERNVAVSLTVPFAFLVGGGIVPSGIGVMGDTGSFGLGMALAGGLVLTGFVFALFVRLPGKT